MFMFCIDYNDDVSNVMQLSSKTIIEPDIFSDNLNDKSLGKCKPIILSLWDEN